MICQNCKETRHTLCRGGTWCDCGHREPAPWDAQAAVTELTQLAQDDRLGDHDIQRQYANSPDEWGGGDRGPELRQPDSVPDPPVPGSGDGT